jgi:hypothetical protein
MAYSDMCQRQIPSSLFCFTRDVMSNNVVEDENKNLWIESHTRNYSDII